MAAPKVLPAFNPHNWSSSVDLSGLRVRLVDAKGQLVGRLAASISTVLQGKDKPSYSPGRDDGDVVVVINAAEIEFTGRKWDQKLYRWHSGFVGGLKEVVAKDLKAKAGGGEVLSRAVRGMLPKNNLRRARMRKLVVYEGGQDDWNEAYLWEWAPRQRKIADRGMAWTVPEGFQPMNPQAYWRRWRGRDDTWEAKLRESLLSEPAAGESVGTAPRLGSRLPPPATQS